MDAHLIDYVMTDILEVSTLYNTSSTDLAIEALQIYLYPSLPVFYCTYQRMHSERRLP